MAESMQVDSQGISVEVSTDLTKLKEGLGEVKRLIAVSPNTIKITPKMDFDEAIVTKEMNKIIRGMESGAARVQARIRLFGEEASKVVVSPRFDFKEQAVRNRMASLIHDMRAQAANANIEIAARVRLFGDPTAIASGSIPLSRLPQSQAIRDQTAGILRAVRADQQSVAVPPELQVRQVGVAGSARIQAPGFGGTSNGAGGSSDFSRFNPLSQGGLNRAFGSAIAATAVIRGGQLAGEVYATSKMLDSSDSLVRAQGRLRRIEAINDVPIVGSINRALNSFTGTSTAVQRQIDDETANRDSTAYARDQRASGNISLARARGREEEAVALESAERIRVVKMQGVRSGKAVELVRQEEELRDIELANIRERKQATITQQGHAVDIADARGNAAERIMAGDVTGAAQMTRYAASLSLRANQEQRLVGVKDPAERDRIQAVNEKEREAFDKEQKLDSAREQKAIAADVASAIVSQQEATLRISRRNYEADMFAFKAAAQAKIDVIEDLKGKQNEYARQSAALSVIQAREEQRVQDTTTAYRISAAASNLRIQQRYHEAELKEFDAQTKAQSKLIENEDERREFRRTRRAQREEIIVNDVRNQVEISAGLGTRRLQAQAIMADQGRLAGVIGSIAGMQSEIRQADPRNRAELVQTQVQELRAMQQSVGVRSGVFAQEFDVNRQIVDPTMGDSTREQTNILKTIADYMAQLVNRTTGAIAG